MKTRKLILILQYNLKCFLIVMNTVQIKLDYLYFEEKYKLIFEKVSFMCVILPMV